VRGKALDSHRPVFFGIVLYEMATGAVPFRGNFRSHLRRHHELVAAGAIRLNPNLPPKLEDVINRARRRTELRYQHAVDIKSELRRLKRDGISRVLPWFVVGARLQRSAARRAATSARVQCECESKIRAD
jgi:hypothetical protein